ncbi:MAG: hypothetical protein IJ737_02455 [Ruminococcus sp.]|nr:hypothetical protein [Ruminococcus sp.]
MTESYRSYGQRPVMTLAYAVLFMPFLAVPLFVSSVGPGKFVIIFISLYLIAVLIGLRISRSKDGSFTADKTSVTFSQLLGKSVTIYFSDIDTIDVYNRRVRTRGNHRGVGRRSFYVETIIITTLDGEEYKFEGEMDIIPSSTLEATGMMDKMFEMGRFRILKKHIEANEIY